MRLGQLPLVCYLVFRVCHGLDNGLALKPPMGWRSWNCFHGDVKESQIRSTIDALVRKRNGKSLLDAGYDHVGVDDGWQKCKAGYKSSFHAEDGTPLVDTDKFPDLKAFVDYGHGKGVKMGWYENNCICLDEYTLQTNKSWAQLAYAGDIKLLRDAGFDSVKLDNCGDDQGVGFVSRMEYIKSTGSPILVENSDQGHSMGPPRGLPTDPNGWCGANFFRAEGDIGPDFGGIVNRPMDLIPFQQEPPISRPGCWAYLDMMEVGNLQGEKAYNESRTHFGQWCILSSPLVIGMDITQDAKLEAVWDILTNEEAIAVNQAWHGHPGRFVWKGWDGLRYSIYAKKMADDGSAQAVLFINTDDGPGRLNTVFPLQLVGLSESVTYSVRDIWGHQDLGDATGNYSIHQLYGHDSSFLLFTPKKDAVIV